MDSQRVAVTFFRFTGWAQRWWAFKQMGLGKRAFSKIGGLQFVKIMGSGSDNGFDWLPNFGVYGLLTVWDSERDAQDFFQHSELFDAFQQNSVEHWTVFLLPTLVHGLWDGKTPFTPVQPIDENKPVAVLTRATVKTRHLLRFRSYVMPVSRSLEGREGLLFSVGIGELPIIEQATFSIWRSHHDMKAYAYSSPQHAQVVRRTRELGWYKEELFSRFEPYATSGSWGGKNPLADFLG